MNPAYVHGYSSREAIRLADQAKTLTGILHHDTIFSPGSRILEAGCGTGSQTIIIAGQNPDCTFLSIDISPSSLAMARERIASSQEIPASQITFQEADIHALTYEDQTFDHIFICFVLEHLESPGKALTELRRVLKPDGTITVIEGDHGSVFFSPPSEAAMHAISSQIELQRRAGGDACIGRRLYPLLTQAGYSGVQVSPRMVYVDASRPELADGFTKKTFTAMIEGVKEEAVRSGLISAEQFHSGVRDLLRTCEPDGTFCYTFFKATGVKFQ
ncbi:MAG: methyltransferase domain-containing protein [Methanobacteriota archaeon]